MMVSQPRNQVSGLTLKSSIVPDTFTNFGQVALVIFLILSNLKLSVTVTLPTFRMSQL